jgi:hypothetical protein
MNYGRQTSPMQSTGAGKACYLEDWNVPSRKRLRRWNVTAREQLTVGCDAAYHVVGSSRVAQFPLYLLTAR